MKPIPYGKQSINQDDIDGVIEVLHSDYLTQGPKIAEFEQKFAEYIGCKYAVAVSNGTAALHLSALALDVKSGDKVITTPITFVASANCVLYCGGEIDFVDIDQNTFLMDLDKLEEKLASNPQGTYKGIIPVDFTGLPIDTERLKKIANKYKLWIIEDACHAPGGYFKNSNNKTIYCGDGQYSDLSIFSFHPVKHIATGEGGMITTNNEELYKQLLLLRTHGITKSPEMLQENHGGWYYEMHELGFNYRLSDLSASLGITQLKRAKEGLQRRKEIANNYFNAFKDSPIKMQKVNNNFSNAFHLFVIQVKNRLELYNYLKSHNIFSQIHYIPVHLQPYYKNFGWKNGDFPIAENYYNECLSLPIYASLSTKEQDYVINTVLEFVK
ncbi:MAG: UDP-4-amino-4,6-dideoxy-N-acetyl-beta-L-altrosamine transaminase [Bacteroidales bacterium]|nr:UDP-4-amino-4,6-dideoxy-N-acetyl-beta-L-altrosamine transaminase [Bacteroidales bacterium]